MIVDQPYQSNVNNLNNRTTSTYAAANTYQVDNTAQDPYDEYNDLYFSADLALSEPEGNYNNNVALPDYGGGFNAGFDNYQAENYANHDADVALENEESFESNRPIRETFNHYESPTKMSHSQYQESIKETFSWDAEVDEALRTVFKLGSFRQNQRQAINAALSGKDVFVLMVGLVSTASYVLI